MKLHPHTSVFLFLFFLVINLHCLPLQASTQTPTTTTQPTTTTTHFSTADADADNTTNDNNSYYNMYTGHVYPSVAIAMLILIVAFFAAGCLAVYLGGCTDAAVASSSNSSRRPLLLPVTILPRGSTTTTHLRVAGLDTPAIDSLPTFRYSDVKELKIGKGSLECAVCLSEFGDDETLKLLPKCDHVFHPACIDPWLAARPTCPVCRADLLVPGDKYDGTVNKNGDRRSEFSSLVVDEPDTPSSSDGGVFRKPDNRQCGKPVLKIVIVEIPTSGGEEQSSGSDSESESERDADQRRTVGEEEEEEQEDGGGMLWRFTRSKSTGNNNNNNLDRFRLTLPEDMRREVLVRSEQLQRSKSFAALPRVSSPRSGYR